MTVWTLQDATNKFSAVVEAAQREPQHVTRRGVDAVVVLSADEFARLTKGPSRKSFVDHLLAAPKLPEQFDDLFDKREPMILEIRDLDVED